MKSGKGFTKKLIWICAIEILILIVVIALWKNSSNKNVEKDVESASQHQVETTSELMNVVETANEQPEESISEAQEIIVPTVGPEIDMNCDHIFEVFNGKSGIETSCRFCGVSQEDLYNAGIVLPDEPCECEYETVMQTNGTPAYECKKCHTIMIKPSVSLTELKLLSDTNAKGKVDDVKYGSFYQNGREWEDTVRFWVIDRSGYTNSESMEVYLAESYSTLAALAFAGAESDDKTNMTLRFYGDGELIYEMTDIILGAEESYAEIDVSDVEVLKVECSTEVDAFGYCFLQGIAWY